MTYVCTSCSAIAEERIGFCPSCGRFSSFMPLVKRPIDDVIVDEKIISINNLRVRVTEYLILRDYKWLKIPKKFSLMIYGSPGAGKSCFMLRFAENLCSSGRVLYNSLEEGWGVSFCEKLKFLELVSAFDVCSINSVNILLGKLKSYDFLFFDSLTQSSLTAVDVAKIMREFEISVIFSVHQTKSGDYVGSSSLAHYVDVLLFCEDKKILIEKSRYQEKEGDYGI